MTEADRIAGLVKQYPKGCPRPAGYLAFHSWAEAQIAQGVYQSWDERSQRWVFPQESTRVYFGEGEAT